MELTLWILQWLVAFAVLIAVGRTLLQRQPKPTPQVARPAPARHQRQ